MSPKSTVSPCSTCFLAVSAARRSTASTSAPVNVVARATSSQNARCDTLRRSVGFATNTLFPFIVPSVIFCSVRT